jgi:hypothetical protein
MVNELERIWKTAVMDKFKAYHGVFLEELRHFTEDL